MNFFSIFETKFFIFSIFQDESIENFYKNPDDFSSAKII